LFVDPGSTAQGLGKNRRHHQGNGRIKTTMLPKSDRSINACVKTIIRTIRYQQIFFFFRVDNPGIKPEALVRCTRKKV
jgi:hypothetical protein